MVRRLALAVLGLAVLGGGVVAQRIYAFQHRYPGVASIERAPDYQDPALLARAWVLPVAARYQQAGLEYQANPSFCGPTTAVDVVRSLGTPIAQDAILSGTDVRTTFGMVIGGMTLDEVAALLRTKTGRPVTVHRGIDLAAFRSLIAQANDPAKRLTLNFDRGPLFGHGGGHHSPVGGYLADLDLVLVLDVNASYKPWLVKSERLFSGIDTVDSSTGQKRGLLVVE
jgi:phytochelatin synthase